MFWLTFTATDSSAGVIEVIGRKKGIQERLALVRPPCLCRVPDKIEDAVHELEGAHFLFHVASANVKREVVPFFVDTKVVSAQADRPLDPLSASRGSSAPPSWVW